jgi:hypothetical protein
MKRLITVALVLILFGYIGLGVHYAVSRENKIQLQEVKLKSTTTDLKELQLKYNVLNSNLDKELQKNTTDNTQLQQLQSEKQDLEKQKQDLEGQLQAKLEQKQKDQYAANTAARSVANALTGTATVSAAAIQDKYAVMASAGISSSDYQAVDYIVSHEGGYEPCKVNGGAVDCNYATNGGQKAYGVCQAMPGSKMASAGADWATNIVTQLRWCSGYANKYGGWVASFAFWQSNKWW